MKRGDCQIAVIGAGVGGLVSAIDLARQGFAVQVFERYATPGGKLRQISIEGIPMDAGPTVFTMPRVFDQLFDDAGDDFRHRVPLVAANLLARHFWLGGEHLDLFADQDRSADAISRFAGPREGLGFRRFIEQSRRIYKSLDKPFMQASRPSPLDLVRRVGLGRLATLWDIRPFATLWKATGEFFEDPRLRQLFARYATYCGSSPFACPATLMLIAHAEQAGVWYVEGGMHRLAAELAALAERLGCRMHYQADVARIHADGGRVNAIETRGGERIAVDAVVSNADNNALARGLLGDSVRHAVKGTAPGERTLSAVTVNALARTEGLDLAHHTVFFSDDYRAEFDSLFGMRTQPGAPTVYVCAQDRLDAQLPDTNKAERLLCLMNAPPTGDTHCYVQKETDACTAQIFAVLKRHGLKALCDPAATRTTTPEDFHDLFPGTGGALYGPASHGWRASFTRPGSRTRIPGLYLAGGSTHPGPGVPMAAMSGRLAAACISADHAST